MWLSMASQEQKKKEIREGIESFFKEYLNYQPQLTLFLDGLGFQQSAPTMLHGWRKPS